MEFDFGTVARIEIKENADGTRARFVQCQVTADEDAQLFELLNDDDDSPPIGASVFLIDVGGRRVCFLLNDGIAPESPSGEKQIYSINAAGSKAAIITLKADGTSEINGFADFAVRFNQLQTIITAAVQNAVNAELALIATQINTLGGTYEPTPLNVDLTPAKVEEVKLP